MVFLIAGVWELVRFVAIFLSSAAAPTPLPNAHLNLLWLAGPALLFAGLLFAAAYNPGQIRTHLPILRIGGTIAVLTDIAVVTTGSFDWTVTAPAIPVSRLLFLVAVGILIVDLAVAAYLFWRRLPDRVEETTSPQPSDDELPPYDPTSIDGQ